MGEGEKNSYKCKVGIELGVKISRALTECLRKIQRQYAGMLCVTHQQDILIKQLSKVVSPEEQHCLHIVVTEKSCYSHISDMVNNFCHA